MESQERSTTWVEVTQVVVAGHGDRLNRHFGPTLVYHQGNVTAPPIPILVQPIADRPRYSSREKGLVSGQLDLSPGTPDSRRHSRREIRKHGDRGMKGTTSFAPTLGAFTSVAVG